MLHLKLQLLWPWLQQHDTSTTVKQHSHADLNVCINPPLRSPAQTHVLQFHCLVLSYLPKIYSFQTWYSLFLYHSVLCLGSPCHPTANAKPNDFDPVPAALYVRFSGVLNIMTRSAYKHTSNSFFIHCYTTTEIISSMHIISDQYPENQLVTSSHSGVAPHSSLLYYSCSQNSFLPLDYCLAASSALPSLSNKRPWSSKGHTTHCVYSPWYGTQSHAPNPSACNPEHWPLQQR